MKEKKRKQGLVTPILMGRTCCSCLSGERGRNAHGGVCLWVLIIDTMGLCVCVFLKIPIRKAIPAWVWARGLFGCPWFSCCLLGLLSPSQLEHPTRRFPGLGDKARPGINPKIPHSWLAAPWLCREIPSKVQNQGAL